MKAFFLIAALATVANAEDRRSLEFLHPELKEWAKEQRSFEDYARMRAKHYSQDFADAGHPRERTFDLNSDGKKEVFLLFSGHSYWASYSGFTQRKGKWVYIGRFGFGGRTPIVLKTRRQGWHDFTVDRDASRGRIDRDIYKWDAKAGMYSEGHHLRTVRPAFEVNETP